MKALLIVMMVSTAAYAEPVVLAIDGKDIYVDLGAKDGVGEGSELELLHEIIAKDPRTGAPLRDRFALGTLTVVKAGAGICVAHADGELLKRVLAGDHVRLVSQKRKFVDPWAEQVAASKPVVVAPPPPPVPGAPPVDHPALVRQAWQDTLGKSPEERIARWQDFLDEQPQTPYRKAIEGEVQSLRAQIALRDEALAKARNTSETGRRPRIEQLTNQLESVRNAENSALVVGSITRGIPGRSIEMAFLSRTPSVTAAFLYVRPEGEPGFRRIALVRDGDSYFRGSIAGELVRGSQLAWYVEAAGNGAEPQADIGDKNAPRIIAIDRVIEEAPIESGRSHVDAHVDYVDFDGGLQKGFDQYYQAEIDFTYRFLTPIYAARIGFGTMTGTGGPKDVIDLDNNCIDEFGSYRCKRVSFTYVYTEFEYKLRPNVAVMLRPQAGLLTTDTSDPTMSPDSSRCRGSSDISGCQFLKGFGARMRARFGEELGTNLVLGVGFTDGVGTLLEAAYNWLPSKYVPVQLSVQVTDQPVPEDFGVRLIGDVGYRKLSWFYPSLRISYQARDIDHSGLSGGAAMNFDW